MTSASVLMQRVMGSEPRTSQAQSQLPTRCIAMPLLYATR